METTHLSTYTTTGLAVLIVDYGYWRAKDLMIRVKKKNEGKQAGNSKMHLIKPSQRSVFLLAPQPRNVLCTTVAFSFWDGC